MRTQYASQTPRQPTALLVDDRLRREMGAGLIETVHRLRTQEPPMTWTEIAERLSRWTDVNVSRQLLQQWVATWGDEAA